MAQNEKAYDKAITRGETLFNEAAFVRQRALYDGQLIGHPFRAVVKSFQVRVWRELKASWRALDARSRDFMEKELGPEAAAGFGNIDLQDS